MSWIDVAVLTGLAFALGFSIGSLVELWNSAKELNEMWKIQKRGDDIADELQNAMMAQIENYKNYTEHQRVYIEKLIEYINKPNEVTE